ncbi:MAG: hypothetical protein HYX94_10210 [Chloroflexi bacterium]|nr:hypothetical protein [Chloroflexota bacterium]
MAAWRKYWNERAETMSVDELRTVQERRILSKLDYVYRNSGLHRKVWDAVGLEPGDVKSLEDFQRKVPCIDKEMVRRYREETGDPFGGLLCAPPQGLYVAQSSGTTGVPTFVPFTKRDLDVWIETWARAYWALGDDEEGARPGETLLVQYASFHSYARPHAQSVVEFGANALIVGTDSFATTQVVHYLRHFNVDRCYFLVAPFIEDLRSVAKQFGLTLRDLFAKTKCIGIAGEVITPGFRRRLEEEIGTRVFDTGGSIPELGTLWSECGEKRGFVHMHGQDLYLSEVTDPATGKPVAPGEVGEHTVTNFAMEAMPCLRYATDDLVVADPEPICPYGRNSIRLKFLGREAELLRVSGKSLFVSQVKACVEEMADLREGVFQVIRPQPEMSTLRLRVGYEPARVHDLEDLRRRLCLEVQSKLGVEVSLEFALLAELTKLHPYKVPRVSKE